MQGVPVNRFTKEMEGITESSRATMRNLRMLMLTESMNEWQLFQHLILWSADYIFGRVNHLP